MTTSKFSEEQIGYALRQVKGRSPPAKERQVDFVSPESKAATAGISRNCESPSCVLVLKRRSRAAADGAIE
jgi:hypothetical protein